MLVSVDFELLVQHPSHKKTAKTVFDQLLHWSDSNSSVELLALVKTKHHPSAIEKLEEFLVNASWHGRYTLKRWAPLAETRKNQRINRELMLHHAKWYGAEAHIDIATWPFEIQSKIPHGILLVSNEWPLSKRERIKTKLRASVLVERFNKYSAVALCKGCRASELLTEKLQNQHAPEDLMHALAVATREREKDTRSLSLAWVSPMPPQKTGIAGYSELLLHELSKHYNLTVITDTPSTCTQLVMKGCPL